MTHHTTQHTTDLAPNDPRVLEEDLAHQRDELARTVQDLHDRLDVKTRAQERAAEMKWAAQERAHEVRDRATTDDGRPRPVLIAAGAAAVAVPLAVLVARTVWRRRRAARAPLPVKVWTEVKKELS